MEEKSQAEKDLFQTKEFEHFHLYSFNSAIQNGACIFDSQNKLSPRGPKYDLVVLRGRPNKCEYSTSQFEVRPFNFGLEHFFGCIFRNQKRLDHVIRDLTRTMNNQDNFPPMILRNLGITIRCH